MYVSTVIALSKVAGSIKMIKWKCHFGGVNILVKAEGNFIIYGKTKQNWERGGDWEETSLALECGEVQRQKKKKKMQEIVVFSVRRYKESHSMEDSHLDINTSAVVSQNNFINKVVFSEIFKSFSHYKSFSHCIMIFHSLYNFSNLILVIIFSWINMGITKSKFIYFHFESEIRDGCYVT